MDKFGGTSMDIKKMLKNPPKEYRPIPFWSWNEKLSTEETARQIQMMDEIGIGGYFMHARGGLETEYMSDEWFANTDVGVNEGEKRGMGAWAYDENGWPSGFASGEVNGLGLEYQQKYLRMEPGEKQTDRTICNLHGKHFYFDVNPFYVDTLDKKVIQKFIECSYARYEARYGKRMPGVFTDEPQVSRDGIPWSFVMPTEYEARFGENLLEHLDELFEKTGEWEKTRFQFWKLVTDLFTEAFAKQIYDFCEEHGMQLTGHMVLEEELLSQLTSNGAVMPNYEFFHMPGMDWLCRKQMVPQTPLQVASVSHQLGKKKILSETFALCGHNVSFEELRWIYEGQMVRGVNMLCPHLEGYSLRGIRKRDYPPAMYYQQPWWEEYKTFIDAMSRIGMLIAEGKPEFDTLLLHPQSTAWTLFDNDKNEGMDELQAKFNNAIRILEQKHILFHLGDETILSRHARVEGASLVVGNQRYTQIVKPIGAVLFESTKTLLEEFEQNGGKLLDLAEVQANPVTDNPNLVYTKRSFAEFDMHYFVNETNEVQKANIAVGGKRLDIKTGELVDFCADYTFAAYDSLVVIDDRTTRTCGTPAAEKKVLPVDGEWKLSAPVENALTLDYCDYWFDGELIDTNAYILDVADRANKLEKKVAVKVRYHFNVEDIPQVLYLVCETPDRFEILVNGQPVSKQICGYFRDASFKKLDIAALVKRGENEITFLCDFEQSPEVYQMIKNSKIFESEKNKLYYTQEIEGVFLVGSFGVKTDAPFEALSRDAYRYRGGFTLVKQPEAISLTNIEQQGFPFFSGRMRVSKNITVSDCDYKLSVAKKGINAIGVKVNQKDAGCMMWNPYELDLSEHLQVGENEIELTLVNNLRNLMGPHHLAEGESYVVGPHSFYKNDSPFYSGVEWDDDYCFVETTIK